MHVAKLALFLLPGALMAQANPDSCEADSSTLRQLQQVAGLDSQDGNVRAAQLRLLDRFIAQSPDNLDLHLRYQQIAGRGVIHAREDVIARYKQLAATHPGSAPYQFLYASALLDTDTPQAIRIADYLLQTAPNFPRAHLILADIYGWGKFADKPKSRGEISAFFGACPAALNRPALGALQRIAHPSLAAQLGPPLRARLQRETDPLKLERWQAVWNLEFKANSPAEHGKVRAQIAADLVRLTQIHPDGDAEWLSLLKDGYKLAANPEMSQKEEAMLLAEYPQSDLARRISNERWRRQHPWPGSDPVKWKAFQQANLQHAEEQLKAAPRNLECLWARFSALSTLDAATDDQLLAAADAFLAQYRKTPDILFSPPPQLAIARSYLKRKIRVDQVPALVGEASNANLLFNGPPSDRLPNSIRARQAQFNDYLITENADVLIDAARQLGKPYIARDAVAKVAALKPEMPLARISQFTVEAKWAELQNRNLDALLFYRAALDARPSGLAHSGPAHSGKDELADNIARLRKALGGTAASQALWDAKPHPLQTADATGWEKPGKDMKPWQLTDLHGKSWKLVSFEGKALLINVWATWCGPCQAEHPHLQELYNRLKSDPNIQIVTFNVDDEIGGVAPYMKQHSYTFPVLFAKDYVDDVIGSFSIPRNWIVDSKGTWQWEQLGFGNPKT